MFSLHKQLLTVSHKLSIAIIPCNYFLYIFFERYYLSELTVLPVCLYFFNKGKMKILQGGRVFGDVSVIIAEQRKHAHKMISLFSKEKVPDEFSSFMFSECSIYLSMLWSFLIENSLGINILISGACLIFTFQNYPNHLRPPLRESSVSG